MYHRYGKSLTLIKVTGIRRVECRVVRFPLHSFPLSPLENEMGIVVWTGDILALVAKS